MGRRLATAALLTLIVLGVLQVALVSARFPWSGGDFVSSWGLRARAIYRSGDLSSIVRVDPDNLFAHPEYPLAWPLLLVAISRLSGSFDPLHFSFLWPLLCLSSSVLAKRATRAPALYGWLAGAAVALLPYYRTALYCGYAEPLLAVLVLGAISEVDVAELDRLALFRVALLLTFAAATKQEGFLLAMIVCVVLTLERKSRAAAIIAGCVLFYQLCWTLFVISLGPKRFSKDFSLSSFRPSNIVSSASFVWKAVMLPNAAWIVGIMVLVAMAPKTRSRRRGRFTVIGLYLPAVFGSMAFTHVDPVWYLGWAWDRLLLVPIVLLVPVLAECVAECVFPGEAPAIGPPPAAGS